MFTDTDKSPYSWSIFSLAWLDNFRVTFIVRYAIYSMCFSFWGVPQGDSRLINQSATWLVNLRGGSISPGNTPKAKTHTVLTRKFGNIHVCHLSCQPTVLFDVRECIIKNFSEICGLSFTLFVIC
jgi:hypothetical protein